MALLSLRRKLKFFWKPYYYFEKKYFLCYSMICESNENKNIISSKPMIRLRLLLILNISELSFFQEFIFFWWDLWWFSLSLIHHLQDLSVVLLKQLIFIVHFTHYFLYVLIFYSKKHVFLCFVSSVKKVTKVFFLFPIISVLWWDFL